MLQLMSSACCLCRRNFFERSKLITYKVLFRHTQNSFHQFFTQFKLIFLSAKDFFHPIQATKDFSSKIYIYDHFGEVSLSRAHTERGRKIDKFLPQTIAHTTLQREKKGGERFENEQKVQFSGNRKNYHSAERGCVLSVSSGLMMKF